LRQFPASSARSFPPPAATSAPPLPRHAGPARPPLPLAPPAGSRYCPVALITTTGPGCGSTQRWGCN